MPDARHPTRSHGRFPYGALPDRPVFDWPNGRRLAVSVALNVECFSFGKGDGAQLAPKGHEPDVLNASWREWGNRVGVWLTRPGEIARAYGAIAPFEG